MYIKEVIIHVLSLPVVGGVANSTFENDYYYYRENPGLNLYI